MRAYFFKVTMEVKTAPIPQSPPNKDKHYNDWSRATYRYDRVRGLFQGFGDAAWMTFIMLVAIRVYDAPSWLKATIAGTGFVGYFFNPLTLALGARTHLRTTQLCAGYLLVCAALMLGAAWAPNLWVYATLVVAWQLVITQVSPVMIQVYSDNYAPKERGRRWSTSFMFASITGSLFAYFGGKLLDLRLSNYTWIFVLIAVASVCASLAVFRIPSQCLRSRHTGNPWHNLSLIWKDSLFGWVLMSWTLMSLAHWMMMPLRFEYMTDSKYGLGASNEQVAVITFMVPAITQILTAKLWGYLFDHLNFMYVRTLINGAFIIGFILFFIASSMVGLGVGSVLIGFASCGGMIASNIWVTKIAEPNKAPAYMSAHSALSGARGLLAPFLGYLFISQLHPLWVSVIAAVMAILSSWMFLKVRSHPRMR